MRIRFETFAFILFTGFAIIGAITFSIVFHELSHYRDFHTIVTKDDICVLNVPTTFDAILVGNAGWYSYNYNYSNLTIRDTVADTGAYTEGKAYTITFVFMAIFMVLMIVIIKRRVESNIKADLYDKINKEIIEQ